MNQNTSARAEQALIDAALALAGESRTAAALLPIPNTTPKLFVGYGETRDLARLVGYQLPVPAPGSFEDAVARYENMAALWLEARRRIRELEAERASTVARDGGEVVPVPRDLIASACYVLNKSDPNSKTLAALRSLYLAAPISEDTGKGDAALYIPDADKVGGLSSAILVCMYKAFRRGDSVERVHASVMALITPFVQGVAAAGLPPKLTPAMRDAIYPKWTYSPDVMYADLLDALPPAQALCGLCRRPIALCGCVPTTDGPGQPDAEPEIEIDEKGTEP